MSENTTTAESVETAVNVEKSATVLTSAARLLRFASHPSHGQRLIGGEGLFDPQVSARVADWLAAEAALLLAVRPFTVAVSYAIEQATSGAARLSLGEDSDGDIRMALDSSQQAVAVAEAILAKADALGIAVPA